MTSPTAIPSLPTEWLRAVAASYPGATSVDISGISQNDFGSASKLSFDDFLLLRVIWPSEKGRLTHDVIFGDLGPELRAKAKKALSKEPWMAAMLANNDNPLKWSYLAPWKLSIDNIMSRNPSIESALAPSRIYDDSDPFRLIVEPSSIRDRPRREVQQPTSYVNNASGSEVSSNPSSRQSLSSVGSHDSPSLSEKQGAESGSPASGPRRAESSSPDSGTSAEARIINKHRPDEALINMSLILLLQGVCMRLLHDSPYKLYEWSIVHKQFSVTQPDRDHRLKRTKILTAKTDGCLQVRRSGGNPDDGDTLAIVEVKPYRRDKPAANAVAIRIQESAEMAAWISTDVKTGFLPGSSRNNTIYRLLISQDYDQIFVTIAEFDDSYVQYIRGDSVRWPMASRSATETSPSRDAQSSTATTERSDGLPFRSRIPTPQTPVGRRSVQHQPTQPSRTPQPSAHTNRNPQSATPRPPTQELPPAPKQDTSTIQSEGVFLKMRQFKPFNIYSADHMRELAYLLYTLTEDLCDRDRRLRLQLNEPGP